MPRFPLLFLFPALFDLSILYMKKMWHYDGFFHILSLVSNVLL